MLAFQFVFHLTLQRNKVEAFDRYPFNLPAIRTLVPLELHPEANRRVRRDFMADPQATLARRFGA